MHPQNTHHRGESCFGKKGLDDGLSLPFHFSNNCHIEKHEQIGEFQPPGVYARSLQKEFFSRTSIDTADKLKSSVQ